MNALARSVVSTVPRVTGRRFQSSVKQSSVKQPTFKQTWLSDPSTYPIFGVLAFAGGLCAVFATSKLIRSPDVRISPARKNSPVRLD